MGRSALRLSAKPMMGDGDSAGAASSKRRSRRALSNAASNLAFLDSLDARRIWRTRRLSSRSYELREGANEAPADYWPVPLSERKLYALLPGPITAANLTWFQKRGDRPKNFDHKSTNSMPPQCQLTEASEEDETLSQHSEILPGRKWFREGMTSSTWRRQRRLRNSVQNVRRSALKHGATKPREALLLPVPTHALAYGVLLMRHDKRRYLGRASGSLRRLSQIRRPTVPGEGHEEWPLQKESGGGL